jgi:hypothetical protein
MSERFCHVCGIPRPDGATFCPGCGSAVEHTPRAPHDGGVGGADPAASTPADTSTDVPLSQPASLRHVPPLLWGALAAVVVLVVALVVVLTRPDSTSTTDTPALSPPTIASLPPATPAATGGEILLEAVSVEIPDVFMTDMALDQQPVADVALPPLPTATITTATPTTATITTATITTATPTTTTVTTATTPPAAVELASVAGSVPGLYGGTRDMVACDQPAMISFLEANPDKAAAWAGVHGIDPTEIRSYIEGLTAVVLTRDTRVTNHGFIDGRAFPHQSILQAGHAVLVDEFGVPRAKCSCGNPLAPPRPVASSPTYVGEAWPEFDVTIVIVVVAVQPVKGGFVVIDLNGGKPFVRPVGVTPGDGDLATDTLCDLFPDDPLCASEPEPTTPPEPVDEPEPTTPPEEPVGPPTGEVVTIAEVGNIAGVMNGATVPFEFAITEPVYIVSAYTYHWNDAQGRAPGTIGFERRDGLSFGPFPARGSDGQGGVPNAYWTIEPDVILPAGNYRVIDSDPSTWSQNAGTGGIGMGQVRGIVVTGGDVSPVDEAGVAAITIIDMLLLDCGRDVGSWIDGGRVPGGRLVNGKVDGRWVSFVVNRPLGNWSVSPSDQRSADIAVACGFYSP